MDGIADILNNEEVFTPVGSSVYVESTGKFHIMTETEDGGEGLKIRFLDSVKITDLPELLKRNNAHSLETGIVVIAPIDTSSIRRLIQKCTYAYECNGEATIGGHSPNYCFLHRDYCYIFKNRMKWRGRDFSDLEKCLKDEEN